MTQDNIPSMGHLSEVAAVREQRAQLVQWLASDAGRAAPPVLFELCVSAISACDQQAKRLARQAKKAGEA